MNDRPLNSPEEIPDDGETLSLDLRAAAQSVTAFATEECVGALIGPFKLLRQLGEGGFGTVWEAEQEKPVKRKVAVKIIKCALNTPDVINRFEAERQAMALMEHSSIPKIFDAGQTEITGRPYIVMELVTGEPLTTYCDKHQAPVKERLRIFAEICRAVHHAHQKGVIHRDLKPSNILVSICDGKAVPKILDFGIAKALHGRLSDATLVTNLHQVIGSLAYMSPEQAETSLLGVDTRSDVYSLGVILYELLSGSCPFPEEALARQALHQACQVIREEEPPKPSTKLTTLTPDDLVRLAHQRSTTPPTLQKIISSDLSWVMLKCLEKNRNRRYDSASELASEVENWLEDRPVSATKPSHLYVVRKFILRNRAAVAAAGIVVIAVIAALIASQVFFAREQEQRRVAEHEKKQAVEARLQTEEHLVVARQEEGRAWLERAQLAHAEMRYLDATVLAAKSIGFVGLGRDEMSLPMQEQYPVLLPSNTEEWHTARMLALSSSRMAVAPLWVSGSPKHHDDKVTCVAYSPDGTQIVSGSLDGTLKLWDAQTGLSIGEPLKGHSSVVTDVAFSPNSMRIVSGSSDKTLRLWNAQNGEPVGEPLVGHMRGVNSVAFSPDSTRIASGAGTIRLWDGQNGESIGEPLQLQHLAAGVAVGYSGDQYFSTSESAVVFSPDGRFILYANEIGLELWDMQSESIEWDLDAGEELSTSNFGKSIAFLPDGSKFITCSTTGELRIRSTLTGDIIGEPLIGHLERATSVAVSPDGTRIVSGSHDDSLRLWDAKTGEQIGEPLPGHSGNINCVAFSPDGTRIVSGSAGNTIKLWDGYTGEPIRGLPKGHALAVTCVGVSPDGMRIVSGSEDSTLRLWDSRTGEQIGDPLLGHFGAVNCVAFSPDGRQIVSGSKDQTFRSWNAQSGESLFVHSSNANCIAFSPDGLQIISGSDNFLRKWDARTGEELGELIEGHFTCIGVSPDGTRIVTGSDENTLRIWDAHNGNPIGEPLLGHSERISCIAFSPNGEKVVSGSDDNMLVLWNVRSGKQIRQMHGHLEAVTCVSFSPDGGRIVSGSVDKTLRLWDGLSGEPIHGAMELHHNAVLSASFGPTGEWIVSGSADHTLCKWDLDTFGLIEEPLVEPELRGNFAPLAAGSKIAPTGVTSLAFSPDGTRLALGRMNGTLRQWNIQTRMPIGRGSRSNSKPGSNPASSPKGEQTPSGQEIPSAPVGLRMVTNIRHPDKINDISYSPDSSKIVSASKGGKLLIWDTKSGKQIGEPLVGNSSTINCVAFSPDGARIAYVLGGNILILWDAQNGELIDSQGKGYTGRIRDVIFSPDGRRIVSGSSSGDLKIWDPQSGDLTSNPLGHSGSINSLAFSSDGSKIILGQDSTMICIQDLVTGELTKTPTDSWISSPESTNPYRPGGYQVRLSAYDPVTMILTSVGTIDILDPLTYDSIIYCALVGGLTTTSSENLLRQIGRRQFPSETALRKRGSSDNYIRDSAISPDGTRIALLSKKHEVWILRSGSISWSALSRWLSKCEIKSSRVILPDRPTKNGLFDKCPTTRYEPLRRSHSP